MLLTSRKIKDMQIFDCRELVQTDFANTMYISPFRISGVVLLHLALVRYSFPLSLQ